jgi:hypothetical protein
MHSHANRQILLQLNRLSFVYGILRLNPHYVQNICRSDWLEAIVFYVAITTTVNIIEKILPVGSRVVRQ